MTVAFDASTELIRTDTSDPITFTHTPAGTPRGVGVLICHNTSATDHVSTVDYGGVALTEKAAGVTTIELGRVEAWFVGSGIPTGAQTVTVDLSSGTTDDFAVYCVTFTASADTEVVDADQVTGLGNSTGTPVTLSVSGRSSMAVGIFFTGRANPTDITLDSGITSIDNFGFGANAAVLARQTSVSTSDFSFGGTQPSDDYALAVMSIAEASGVTGTGALSLSALTAAGTGAETFTGTGALALASTTTAGTGAETFTGTGALALASATVAGTGAETFTGTGALSLATLLLSGSGLHIESITGTGALLLAALSVSGTDFVTGGGSVTLSDAARGSVALAEAVRGSVSMGETSLGSVSLTETQP